MSNHYIIHKKDCRFENGYILDCDEIIGINGDVHRLLERLELMAQQYEYLMAQPAPCHVPVPTLENFKRKSALHADLPYEEMPATPAIDAQVAQSMAFVEEQDALEDARDLNKMIDKFATLFDWVAADEFPEGNCTLPLDLPTLGNPLELTAEQVKALLKQMVYHPAISVNFMAL